MPDQTHVPEQRQAVAASRRATVAELYLKGWTQQAIAENLNVCLKTIYYDIRELHEEWRQARIRTVDELVLLELARIDRVEREAWAAYERSQEDDQTDSMEKVTGGKYGDQEKVKKKRRGQYGDHKLLSIIQNCTEQRLKLIPGLSAPQRHFHTADDSFVPVVTVVVNNREEAQQAMGYEEFKKITVVEEPGDNGENGPELEQGGEK